MAVLFFSYSHKDEILRNELETHLAPLKREGIIEPWHDRRLVAGDELDDGIDAWLERADVILLLVSPDFLDSDYCYGKEMTRALERHQEGTARVIPVILRPCDWHTSPFGKLLAAPKDGKPITSWRDQDEAFLDVVKAIRAAVGARPAPIRKTPASPSSPPAASTGPRSSNLRLRKTFSDRDRDAFMDEVFDYMAQFFENSLVELERRYAGIEIAFKRIDATKFAATVYRNGKTLARCTIKNGGHDQSSWGGITLSLGQHSENSINESLSVEIGEHDLYLKSIGFSMRGGDRNGRLSKEAAAEYYWSIFIEPLQG
jgi:hypothetical protein